MEGLTFIFTYSTQHFLFFLFCIYCKRKKNYYVLKTDFDKNPDSGFPVTDCDKNPFSEKNKKYHFHIKKNICFSKNSQKIEWTQFKKHGRIQRICWLCFEQRTFLPFNEFFSLATFLDPLSEKE